MTRLGAQWTMATIMGAALLGLAYYKGMFAGGPTWPQGLQGTHVAKDHAVKDVAEASEAEPQVTREEEPADEPDLAEALDSALDRSAETQQDAAIRLPETDPDPAPPRVSVAAPAVQAETPRTPARAPLTGAAQVAASPVRERVRPPARASRRARTTVASYEPVHVTSAEYRPAPPREWTRPLFVGSLRVPPRYSGQSLQEQVEAMRAAADVTPEQAGAAALSELPSATVTTITIGNENGYLVYRVQLAGNDGRVHDLLVDAGTARVSRTSPLRSRARTSVYVGEDEAGRPQ